VSKEINLNDGCQVLISRHPLGAAKDWIEANEKEICAWARTRSVDRRIVVDEEFQC
jgi:hypothetical protein